MSRRVCPTPRCPNLTDGGKCSSCKAKAEQARGSSTARGYGSAHQRERKRLAPRVASGRARCRRCRNPIRPDDPWDVGHPDDDCPAPKGPEHVGCNRATAGR